MKLSEYLKTTNRYRSANEFSLRNGIPVPVISRFLKGNRNLSVATMAKIVAATGCEVTYEDLIAEMQERQAARKKRNGSDQAGQQETVPPGI